MHFDQDKGRKQPRKKDIVYLAIGLQMVTDRIWTNIKQELIPKSNVSGQNWPQTLVLDMFLIRSKSEIFGVTCHHGLLLALTSFCYCSASKFRFSLTPPSFDIGHPAILCFFDGVIINSIVTIAMMLCHDI